MAVTTATPIHSLRCPTHPYIVASKQMNISPAVLAHGQVAGTRAIFSFDVALDIEMP